ncbi:MAG: hypothetical protein FWG40_10915 [Peptococcaceae bacterium]|nr:hypothetical protein [Peptococcaceae bacterium]
MAQEMDWRAQWEAHSDLFVVSNWLERTQDRQAKWPLPAGFRYFSGGDMKLRAGIIVKTREDQEEEFLKAGLLWGAQLSNGARTVIYFVAPQFSERFLRLMDVFGGKLMCKAIYWRERMSPSIFAATGGVEDQVRIERPDWKAWERQINPVEVSYLTGLRTYFESLEPLGARIVFLRNKIVLCRGSLEVAQIKKTANKLVFGSVAKWLGRSAAEKYQKAGWVDADRCLNGAFRSAVEDLLGLITESLADDSLDAKEVMSLLLWENPGLAGEMWGRCVDFPCVFVDGKPLEAQRVYFMASGDEDTGNAGNAGDAGSPVRDLSVVVPILDKPLVRVGEAVWWHGLMKSIMTRLPQYRWDGCVNCLVAPGCQEELRIALEWIRERNDFPCYVLDRGWKQNRELGFRLIDG